MTLEDKIKVMQAAASGSPIECSFRQLGKWHDTFDPAWNWSSCDYRVKKHVPDQLDWSQVNSLYNYHIRTSIPGRGAFSCNRPTLASDGVWWFSGHSIEYDTSLLSSFKKGSAPWQESLICRHS